DSNNVYFDVTRNQTPISTIATTPNQTAAANAVQGIAQGPGGPGNALNPVYAAVVGQQTNADVLRALNALSGQSHASLQSTFIEDSRFVRDAINDRVEGAFS